MKAIHHILIFGLVLGIFLLAGCDNPTGEWQIVSESSDGGTGTAQHNTLSQDIKELESEQTADIYVFVCGYVESPGVYRLSKDARICDALKLAGGISDGGNFEGLNQAEHVTDGQTIYVPAYGEETEPQLKEEADGKVNINSAGAEELMTLPGIGKAKAMNIIQYREEQGEFGTVEELMQIPGIKEGVFHKIKDRIKV